MSPDGVALGQWTFNQALARRELMRMIVLHELAFSLVEYDGFRRFVSSLNPSDFGPTIQIESQRGTRSCHG
jgi:hypothetical protein